MGLSSVQALTELYPEAIIYYALPSWIVPLYKHYEHPRVKILALKMDTLTEQLEMALEIRSLRVDAIYELHQSGRGKRFFTLLSFFMGQPYGFHNHHLKSGGPVRDQGVIKPLIQRDLDGLSSFFRPQGKIKEWDYRQLPPVFQLAESFEKKERLILGVVATRETKMYPLHLYSEFIRELKKNYPKIEVVIPLSRSAADMKIKEALLRLEVDAEIVHLPLEELPSYFAQSKYYIGNDTGLKHLAVSLALKTMTLFGPEPPLEWHPYQSMNHLYYYREPLECRTREGHYCGLAQCDSMICLNTLRPVDLLESIQDWF